MLIVIGSTVALIASLMAFSKPRNYWSTFARGIFMLAKYNLVGLKELFLDIIHAKYNKTDLPKKSDCVAIVTGGSRGIGVEVVKMLLRCDMEVIIACRRKEAGEKTIDKIRASGITEGKAKVYVLDNSSLDSVKKFANDIKKDYDKIHVLINNGTEENFARVINISSCAHHLGTINFDDINYNKRKPFLTYCAYGQSKLAQVIFTETLRHIINKNELFVKTYAVHPGMVNTDLFENSFIHYFGFLMKIMFKSPERGARTIVYAAVSKAIEDTDGLYYSNCRKATPNQLVYDKPTQERLFLLSLEQTKLESFLQYC
ncbi:Similar to DHRSX: Dehydrogenase/reductase SDR family member on chromosome X (Homo sapiens) [Cotesia congregata]|uniref:Similar to DHRSX: Dehydrogenase/reductase SDR family member on chromosome X (Homo sapiens) n=1 Tax=Cotesia congregata TaxID=51543 RepID=A0A8J2MRQ2_COTCN|nr:Similar to DHRSX: Dehydrogenase/reductase SDR family member on chromosome X (Homo sapiens) [Cotesia congregata]